MTGKCYYITTLSHWQRHAARFVNSHWIALDPRAPGENAAPDADAKILVLIEADEGVHLSLEGDPAFEALPHPLAQKPISGAARSALASHGVARSAFRCADSPAASVRIRGVRNLAHAVAIARAPTRVPITSFWNIASLSVAQSIVEWIR